MITYAKAARIPLTSDATATVEFFKALFRSLRAVEKDGKGNLVQWNLDVNDLDEKELLVTISARREENVLL
jgi:hypothetical protein